MISMLFKQYHAVQFETGNKGLRIRVERSAVIIQTVIFHQNG